MRLARAVGGIFSRAALWEGLWRGSSLGGPRLRLRMPRDRAGPERAAAQGARRRQAYTPAVDDERRGPAALSGPALRVGGGGGPFAASLLLGRAPALASSSFLATGPPAPPGTTRSGVRSG